MGDFHTQPEADELRQDSLSEPPFCARCGGTCKCEEWRDDDLEDEKCTTCDGSQWLPAIGPMRDGSYITSSPCPECYRGLSDLSDGLPHLNRNE